MESKRILFNFASRSRPQRFWKAIQNIKDNLVNDNILVRVKLDSDDPFLRKYSWQSPFVGRSLSKTHAINRDIPDGGWDILVNMSDDIIWKVKGFDNIIREHCGPDDFVLFPEPYASMKSNQKETGLISVVSIMGYEYYKRDGYVYHPSYSRTHCDNEATDVARMRGRLKEVDIELFYHEHPAAGYPVKDALYRLERKTWDKDAANYKRRKEAGFP